MKHIRLILFLTTILSVLSLASCADDSRFIVKGTTAGADNMNLRFGYNTPEGYRSGIVAVRDGKFEFSGISSQPTLVEMFEHDFKPLGFLWLAGGDKIECVLTPSHPEAMKARGTDINERLSAFLSSNTAALKHSPADANRAIEAYVGSHPDDLLSTLLMVGLYNSTADPAKADSLMATIRPAARPELLAGSSAFLVSLAVPKDSFRPLDSLMVISTHNSIEAIVSSAKKATLLVFSDLEAQRTDSILASMTRVAAMKGARVADVYLSSDTLSWRRMIRGEKLRKIDDSGWERAWLPGNLGAPQLRALGIPSLPYALVCDSAGRTIFRGPDPLEAEDAIRQNLRKN
ncbi:MAG: hypothetical protein K2M06_00710 [Muribaculaceae bacterium]|nr:hypothetical protein [Muribaculaceae bacterium]